MSSEGSPQLQPNAVDPRAPGSLSPLGSRLLSAASTLIGAVTTVSTTVSDLVFAQYDRNYDQHNNNNEKVKRITPKFKSPISRSAPLSPEDFMQAFDEHGRIPDPVSLRRRVYNGGADPEIRSALWEFLLGVYPWSSTYEDRSVMQSENKRKYTEMKALLEEKKKTFTQTQLDCSDLIDKDVNRSDRSHYFFAGDNNENLDKLRRILNVFALVFKPTLAYAQGINDFASMLLFVSNDECDAFWMLARLMVFMGDYFAEDDAAMNRQFHTLIQLLDEHDKPVYEILNKESATDVVFAYRWILLNFKREFTFEESLFISETIWSMPLSEYVNSHVDLGSNPYVIFMALSLILLYREDILNKTDYSDIVIYMNSLSNCIDVKELLNKTECVFWKYIRGEIPTNRLDTSK